MHRLVVPHDPGSAAVVRAQVVRELRERGVDEGTVDDAAVVVSELVGNAVRHGRPMAGGTLCAGWKVGPRMLHVEVQDGGEGPPEHVTARDQWATGGRGLVLLDALARSWGVRPAEGGTSVWAELPLVPVPVRVPA